MQNSRVVISFIYSRLYPHFEVLQVLRNVSTASNVAFTVSLFPVHLCYTIAACMFAGALRARRRALSRRSPAQKLVAD